MEEFNSLDIFKNAFLLEQQGKSLYKQAMEKAKSKEVKYFFKSMVDDKKEHIDTLVKQFKAYQKNKKFVPGKHGNEGATTVAPAILDDSLKAKINTAGFEATAITAAISFERRAVDLYGNRAEESTDPEEKKMYKWLSVLEKTHLNKLIALEESLIENTRNDSNF
ncbi:MAG: ferritin family protein [Desulfobacteraceae bacterium]|nr:ferritin family protein [Desulfobacteraceae bacterium]